MICVNSFSLCLVSLAPLFYLLRLMACFIVLLTWCCFPLPRAKQPSGLPFASLWLAYASVFSFNMKLYLNIQMFLIGGWHLFTFVKFLGFNVKLTFKILCVHDLGVCAWLTCVCVGVHAWECMWRSEDTLDVGPRLPPCLSRVSVSTGLCACLSASRLPKGGACATAFCFTSGPQALSTEPFP